MGGGGGVREQVRKKVGTLFRSDHVIRDQRQKEAQELDCSQSPIFPCDRRDRACLTVNSGHLDYPSYRV